MLWVPIKLPFQNHFCPQQDFHAITFPVSSQHQLLASFLKLVYARNPLSHPDVLGSLSQMVTPQTTLAPLFSLCVKGFKKKCFGSFQTNLFSCVQLLRPRGSHMLHSNNFKAMQVWSQLFHPVLRLEKMPPLSLPLHYFFLGLRNFAFRGLYRHWMPFVHQSRGWCVPRLQPMGDSIACKLKVSEPRLLRGSSEEDKLMWNGSKPEHFYLVCPTKIIQLPEYV